MASSGKPGSFWQRLVGRVAGTADAPAGEPSTQPVTLQPEAAPDAAPSGLQGYELGAEIGRGAMAVVYKATQRSTGRQVAVKRLALSREFSAEDLADVRSRFMREAHAAGALEHPDILQVVDAGQDGNDAWIALEYVLGRDLSLFTRPGQLLPVREVVQIGARLARALAYAHSQGVIHRDIKPANVMLDRVNGSLKLMDFGIARVGDGSRTRTGLVLGTPSFMSPEQLAGLTVDGRSDLYSLGVLLYQLLSGTLPHHSESMARLMQQIATGPARPHPVAPAADPPTRRRCPARSGSRTGWRPARAGRRPAGPARRRHRARPRPRSPRHPAGPAARSGWAPRRR